MLYMSSNATTDGRFTIAVTFDLGTNLDIAQVQVQNRVAHRRAAAAGGSAQPRRDGDEELARHHAGRAPVLAGQVARPALHEQLRDAEIKDVLARVDGVGAITVFGAATTRCGSGSTRKGCRRSNMTAGDVIAGAAGAEHAGRRGRDRRAAGAVSRARSSSPSHARAADRPGRIRATSWSSRPRDAVVRLQRRRPRRARRAGLLVELLSRPQAGGRASPSSSCPGSNALATADAIAPTMDGAVEAISRRAWNTRSSTTRPCSSAHRSTR